MESDQTPPLKAVVIISLPPPDNPSLGKTITTFTLTDDEDYIIPTHQPTDQTQQGFGFADPFPIPATPSPAQPPQNPQSQFSMSSFFLGTPRKLLGIVGIFLFAFLIYSNLVSTTFQELKVNKENNETKSFIFPLYHKNGIREVSIRDVENSLKRFVFKENLVASVDQSSVIGPKSSLSVDNLAASNVAAGLSTPVLPIKGNVFPDGLYYTYMLVGNPPRPYYLDVDTGSDLTWIQCDAPCTSCAKGANALYKPRKGSIVSPKDLLCVEIQRKQQLVYCETCHQCDYEIEYADHSSSMGVLAKDDLRLMVANGSFTKSSFIFGCAYDQQGLLLKTLAKTDGILGLSRAKASLPFQLASRRIINNVVGHCLSGDVDGGGYMFLGDEFVPRWGMVWVPMIDSLSQEFYQTEIVRLNYGNTPLSLGGQDSRVGHITFDSGSSYTYFTKEAYSELLSSFKEVSEAGLVLDTTDSTLPFCWRAGFPIRSVADVKQFFKTLTLQFESKWRIVSTKFRIPPEGYLIVSDKGNVCLGVLNGTNVYDGSTFILGDISLRGQLIVYDNENEKIGWIPSDCDKPKSFQSLPSFEG